MEERQHAVIVAYPGQGHINPLMQLSLRLATSMGFFVTFVAPRGNHDSILAEWQRQGVTVPLLDSIQMCPIPDDMLPPRSMRGLAEFLKGVARLGDGFEKLMAALRADPRVPPVSCVVSDVLLLWARDVARRSGVPWVMFFPLPVSSFLNILAAHNRDSHDPIHIPGELLELPSFLRNPEDPENKLARAAKHDASWVFFNTCPSLDQSLLDAVKQQGFNHCVPVAPLLPPIFLAESPDNDRSPQSFLTSSLWEQDLSSLDWLDRQELMSVLYISFGSIADMDFPQLEILLDGLVAAGEKFLWVFRPDLVSEGSISDDDCRRFSHKAGDHGRLVRWAPQLQVLRHPSIAAFVTHCGWNSTLESICAGVPTICHPRFMDQPLNAKYLIEVWGTGVRLSSGGPGSNFSREDVLRAVNAVMKDGESIRKRALELRDACRKDFQEMDGLKKFAAELKGINTANMVNV